jgi:hypothetical protein
MVVGLLCGHGFIPMIKNLIFVMIASYIAGQIVRAYLKKNVFYEESSPEITEDLVSEEDSEAGEAPEGFDEASLGENLPIESQLGEIEQP